MKSATIKFLTNNFESHARKTESGVEFWLAREIQTLLGYEKWDNFKILIIRAKKACEMAKQKPSDHFADVGKTIEMPKGGEKHIEDLMLSRYACYLIAQNGDPRKEQIAFAQTYFAVQTRKFEIIQQKILEAERVHARKKLASSEKELSGIIFEQTKSDKNFGIIRAKGDKALFGYTTEQMKNKWKIPKGRALADFAPTIILKAKDFATEITIFNVKAHDKTSEMEISKEHTTNNQSVRNTLIERGIRPESLPPEEDVKKVEKKLKSEERKFLKEKN